MLLCLSSAVKTDTFCWSYSARPRFFSFFFFPFIVFLLSSFLPRTQRRLLFEIMFSYPIRRIRTPIHPSVWFSIFTLPWEDAKCSDVPAVFGFTTFPSILMQFPPLRSAPLLVASWKPTPHKQFGFFVFVFCPLANISPPAVALLHMMYESVDVVGLNPSPNPFLMMDYYNQSRGCLIPEKGLVPGAPHPYSTSIRNQHWNGSNHCRCFFFFKHPPSPSSH